MASRSLQGLSVPAALAGVPIIHLWTTVDLGMGELVMVGIVACLDWLWGFSCPLHVNR